MYVPSHKFRLFRSRQIKKEGECRSQRSFAAGHQVGQQQIRKIAASIVEKQGLYHLFAMRCARLIERCALVVAGQRGSLCQYSFKFVEYRVQINRYYFCCSNGRQLPIILQPAGTKVPA